MTAVRTTRRKHNQPSPYAAPRPPTGWNIFLREYWINNNLDTLIGGKTRLAIISSAAAKAWREFSAEQKRPYEEAAERKSYLLYPISSGPLIFVGVSGYPIASTDVTLVRKFPCFREENGIVKISGPADSRLLFIPQLPRYPNCPLPRHSEPPSREGDGSLGPSSRTDRPGVSSTRDGYSGDPAPTRDGNPSPVSNCPMSNVGHFSHCSLSREHGIMVPCYCDTSKLGTPSTSIATEPNVCPL